MAYIFRISHKDIDYLYDNIVASLASTLNSRSPGMQQMGAPAPAGPEASGHILQDFSAAVGFFQRNLQDHESGDLHKPDACGFSGRLAKDNDAT